MSGEDELKTVKAVIRALLIADKRPMPMRSFLFEFKDSEGHEVPYRKFGFSDPLSFLRSISDTVQLSQVGSEFYVRATVTEEVAHVRKLVRGQRESNCKPVRLPPASERPSLFRPAHSAHFSPPRQRPLPIPRYYDALEQVKTNLRVLLAEHLTNGINVRQLQDSYTRRFGSPINYASFGYSAFEDFLIGMSDVVCAVRNSTGATKVFLSKRSGLPVPADMDQSRSTGQSLHSDIQPTGMELQQKSFQSSPTVQSFHQRIQHTGVVPKMGESSQSRPISLSFQPYIQPAGMEPPVPKSSQSRHTSLPFQPNIQPADKKPPIPEASQSRHMSLPFQPNMQPAGMKPPIPEASQSRHRSLPFQPNIQPADKKPPIPEASQSRHMSLPFQPNMQPAGMKPPIPEASHSRHTSLPFQPNIQPAGTRPPIPESSQSRHMNLPFQPNIQPAAVGPLMPEASQSKHLSLPFQPSIQPAGMKPPIPEASQSKHTSLPFPANIQPAGMKAPIPEASQIRPISRSFQPNIQPAGVEPPIPESSQSRPISRSFHPDIQPAGMEQRLPELRQIGPTGPSLNPDIKPGVERAATQELCQSRFAPPPGPSLKDGKKALTTMGMLTKQEILARSDPDRSDRLCHMNPRIERYIKRILRKHPEGIWLTSFAKVYKESTGTELCPADYGYNNMLSLIFDFRHVVSLTRPFPDGDFMVCLLEELRAPELDRQTLNTMKELLRMSGPQGMTVDELLQSFQRVTGKTIDLEDYSLSNEAFVHVLVMEINAAFKFGPEGRVLIMCQGSDSADATAFVRPGATRAPEATKAASTNEAAQVTECAPLTTTLRQMSGIEALRNSDVAEYVEIAENTSSNSSEVGELEQIIIAALTSSLPTVGHIRSPPLFIPNNPFKRPDHLEVGKHYAVYVSQIYSVHHFYIQKKGLDASVRLEALMNQLESVYNAPESSAYLIDGKLVYVGMPCAASYTYSEGNSDWHRGLVVGLDTDPSNCQVLFIDYGTLTFLKKTELRFLRNDFFDLPPQAVRATMEYLRPVTSDGWTPETKAAFIELASGDRTLVCKVLKRRGGLHSVSLCITSHHSEAYVSDLLVEQRLALPTLQYKAVMAQVMEAGPFSILLQDDVPNSPPSVNTGRDTTSPQPTVTVHPSPCRHVVDESTQTALGPQPAHIDLRARDSHHTGQAESHDRIFASDSQATKPVQSLDKEFADVPIDQVQQMQGVPFTLPVQLTSLPHTNGIQRPTPQYSEQVPQEFVIPRQPNTNYYLSLFDVCQRRGIPLPKDWQELFEQEEKRLARCRASTVQPCTESTAQTTMQSTHSSGQPASKPLHCPVPTVGGFAVQSTSPAVQPQFQGSLQLTSKPPTIFPEIPPPPFQKPQATERTTNQPACEAVDDEEDILDLLQQELDAPCPSRAVKSEHLKSGYCLMVVNYEDMPYVTTANVSQLLGWPSDVILQRLEAKHIQFPTLVLERDSDNYWIFNQMASNNVPGVKMGQHVAQQVTLFPLKNVIDLLNIFGCTVLELKEDIATVLYSFDPRSPYWRCVSEDGDLAGSLEQVLIGLCDERVKLRLEILNSQITSEKVDRLASIEDTIERLKKLILAEGGQLPPCDELSKMV
ncbi:uncharacterized protein LOC119396069 isoform X2 [Rhipicephalus sanguineus]|uniref:uncharacterized protein LOC119396069 isoform X2 n=1 Tax=Rhipicephalus sanguineus TaxID=34632 RepID=UPI0018949638|nr:uncharacterized protein LOC119396069 isoform X2 [Rhipicephalus sanguineus]